MEVTVSSLLDNVGTFFTEALEWVGLAMQEIVKYPLLIIAVVCVPIAGIAIGYIKRLFSLSA